MKKNWDKLPVEYLMYSGFKKTEIVKRKNSFGDDGSDYIRLGTNKYFYSNKDLDQFTKAEIAKYDILNKIVLRLQDLNQFNKEEIVEKNLISRVRKITLSDLGPLGFSFDEIKDYAKTDKFREDPVADFIKGKTRDRVLKIALSSWLDGYKNGRDHSNMTSIERSEIRAMLIGILNPTEEEFPLDFALKLFDKNYFKEHGSTSIVECAKFFSRIYKDPSYENVKSIVSIFGNNNSLTSCAELIASGYWNEKAIKVLKKDVLVDRWLTPDYRTMTQLH